VQPFGHVPLTPLWWDGPRWGIMSYNVKETVSRCQSCHDLSNLSKTGARGPAAILFKAMC
jgi:hypothetical protein